MGLEGLIDGDIPGRKLRNGFGTDGLKPFDPERPAGFRAASRSKAPAYEMIFWRFGSSDHGFVVDADGDVVPDLVRVVANEENGCEIVQVPVDPTDPDGPTRVDLDCETFLWKQQNKGNIRVDGIIGPFAGGVSAWGNPATYKAYAKRMLTEDALIKLFRKGGKGHPDAIPSTAPTLGDLGRNLREGSVLRERVTRGAIEADRRLHDVRQVFARALARWERMGSPTTAKHVDPAMLATMTEREAIAYLKAQGHSFAAEEPEMEPIEEVPEKIGTFYGEGLKATLPDTIENRLADKAASLGWTLGEMTGATLSEKGAAGYTLGYMAGHGPVPAAERPAFTGIASAPLSEPLPTFEPSPDVISAEAPVASLVPGFSENSPLYPILARLVKGEIDKAEASTLLLDVHVESLRAALPEGTPTGRSKGPMIAVILSKF